MTEPQPPDHTRLLQVDCIIAYYFIETETLEVFACGLTSSVTTDIRIDEVPWPGSLKFAIQGDMPHWGGFQFYTAKTEKKIKIPSRALPGKTILVEDADHPGGQLVDIKFVGLGK